MVEVLFTDEFDAWYQDLDQEEQESIERAVLWLEQKGVSLGYPQSSGVEGASFALRELRIQHKGDPYRVLYAFDPRRQAVLLTGGTKKGRDRFYEEMIAQAERIWRDYLQESGQRR